MFFLLYNSPLSNITICKLTYSTHILGQRKKICYVKFAIVKLLYANVRDRLPVVKSCMDPQLKREELPCTICFKVRIPRKKTKQLLCFFLCKLQKHNVRHWAFENLNANSDSMSPHCSLAMGELGTPQPNHLCR